MKILAKKITIYAKQCKRLNELYGRDAFADSHGMAYSWYFFNRRITPWFKFDDDWNTYESQIDESFLVFLYKAISGKLNKLNIKTKEEN